MNEKELFRLASLVGTDAKNPKEKLLNFLHQELQKARKELAGEVRLLLAKHYREDEFDNVGFLNDLHSELDQDKK